MARRCRVIQEATAERRMKMLFRRPVLAGSWLEAEHVKKSAGSGYAKYGTKQESIEGALEELNDMIETLQRKMKMLKNHLQYLNLV